jgi:hypothetical protein
MLFRTGMARLMMILWGSEVLDVIKRDRDGGDSTNLVLGSDHGGQQFQVDQCPNHRVVVRDVSPQAAVNYIISAELPDRLDFVASIRGDWACAADNSGRPGTLAAKIMLQIFTLEDVYPSEERMRRMDSLSFRLDGRGRAEKVKSGDYLLRTGTPWAAMINENRRIKNPEAY